MNCYNLQKPCENIVKNLETLFLKKSTQQFNNVVTLIKKLTVLYIISIIPFGATFK